MPDNYGVYPNVNVREYLDFFARAYGLRGAERHASLDRVMRFTHLDELAEKPITGLSKGMKQRLCLGRTLFTIRRTGDGRTGRRLDPRARIELREMIRQLASDGKTILISSHILTELAEMCDIVGIIEQGRMLAVGTVDQILNNHTQAGDQRRSWLRVRVLGGAAGLAKWLEQRPEVSNLQINDELAAFEFLGEETDEVQLLKAMILAEIPCNRLAVKTNHWKRSLCKSPGGVSNERRRTATSDRPYAARTCDGSCTLGRPF